MRSCGQISNLADRRPKGRSGRVVTYSIDPE